jgi:hypothetical protein
VHQVGDQPRLYYDARSTNHQDTKCVFRFSVQLLSEEFLILRGIWWDMIKNVYRCSCKVPPFFVRFENKTWLLWTIFRKNNPRTKFHENPSSESQVVPCGRTDIPTEKHDEANNRFWQFFEKIIKNQISWKSVQWEPSCSMLTDGHTDRETWRS